MTHTPHSQHNAPFSGPPTLCCNADKACCWSYQGLVSSHQSTGQPSSAGTHMPAARCFSRWTCGAQHPLLPACSSCEAPGASTPLQRDGSHVQLRFHRLSSRARLADGPSERPAETARSEEPPSAVTMPPPHSIPEVQSRCASMHAMAYMLTFLFATSACGQAWCCATTVAQNRGSDLANGRR